MYLSVNGVDWHSSIVLCTADNIEGPYQYADTIVYSGVETNPAEPANSFRNTDVEKVLGADPDLSRYLNPAGRRNAEYGTNAIDPAVFYDEKGKLYVIYHNKFDDNFGGHEVRVHQLLMNEDGWFSAAPYEYSGETLSARGHTMGAITGDYRLIWHNPNQKFVNEQSADVEKPISIRLNPDGTVTGDIQASWEMRDGTPYMSFTWGGVTYKGAFIVQQDEADLPVTRIRLPGMTSPPVLRFGLP